MHAVQPLANLQICKKEQTKAKIYSSTKMIKTNEKKSDCTQVPQQKINSDHIMFVIHWHTVQSTGPMLHGAGAYGLAADIWVILWPEANGATTVWLKMRSN